MATIYPASKQPDQLIMAFLDRMMSQLLLMEVEATSVIAYKAEIEKLNWPVKLLLQETP